MSIYLDGMFYRCSGVGRVYENLLAAFAGNPDVGEIHTIVPAMHKERFLEQFSHPMIVPTFVGYGPMGFGDLVEKIGFPSFPAGKGAALLLPRAQRPPVRTGEIHRQRQRRHRLLAAFPAAVVPQGRFPLAPLAGGPRGGDGGDDLGNGEGGPGAGVRAPAGEDPRDLPVDQGDLLRAAPAAGSPVSGEYLLYLGLRIAHKNVEGVIRAFLLLLDDFPKLKLVIAGSRYSTPDMVDRWKGDPRLMGRLIEIPDPSDDDIARLFGGAKAFVFPSFAEGFGLPPLEAMASGVPVVCSDIPVFREVYGDAVRYVDPSRPESIAAGIREVLDDSGLSGSLRQRGRERASIYRQERSIRKYLDLAGGRRIGT